MVAPSPRPDRSGHSAVMDAERLMAGGSLAVIPFTAGAGVAVDAETDTVALMVAKGIIETIGSNGSLELVSGSDAQTAQLVLQGHVTALKKPGGVKKWLWNKNLSLGVDGYLVDTATGASVAYLFGEQNFHPSKKNVEQAAYEIGQEIGQFLLNAAGNQRSCDDDDVCADVPADN